MPLSLRVQWRLNKQTFTKSCTQVATKVLPKGVIPSSGGLKPEAVTGEKLDNGKPKAKKKPSPIPVRASEHHKAIIREKANAAGIAISRYMLIAALGADYKPPADPELTKALLKLNRELTAQGNNLNQIARHLNSGQVLPTEGEGLLGIISRSMLQTHKAIRSSLLQGKTPEP